MCRFKTLTWKSNDYIRVAEGHINIVGVLHPHSEEVHFYVNLYVIIGLLPVSLKFFKRKEDKFFSL